MELGRIGYCVWFPHTDPVGLLLSHRADWAIVSEVEQNDDVLFKPLFSYEMVGICSKDHPLANKEVWQAEDFAEETWVTYPVPDDMLDLYRQVLKPKGINPPRRTTELTIALIQLVASRRGIATVPYWAALPYLEKRVWWRVKLQKKDCSATLMQRFVKKMRI